MGSTSDSTTEAERISNGLCFNVFVVNKTQNRDFDVLFPSTTVKRSPIVCMFTCSYYVFIISKLIVFYVAVANFPFVNARCYLEQPLPFPTTVDAI